MQDPVASQMLSLRISCGTILTDIFQPVDTYSAQEAFQCEGLFFRAVNIISTHISSNYNVIYYILGLICTVELGYCNELDAIYTNYTVHESHRRIKETFSDLFLRFRFHYSTGSWYSKRDRSSSKLYWYIKYLPNSHLASSLWAYEFI